MKKVAYVLGPRDLGAKANGWLEKSRDYRPAGPAVEFSPANAALFVVDMQHFFLDSASHAFVPAAPALVPGIQALVSAFRKAGRPVVFTRYAVAEGENPGLMGEWWKDVIKEGSPASAVIPQLQPAPGERVLRKKTYSAFHGTGLQEALAGQGVDSLVITGVLTHLCCDTLAREAFTRDFKPYLVVDGTASYDEELHLASLKTLAHGFAVPVLAREILDALGKVRP